MGPAVKPVVPRVVPGFAGPQPPGQAPTPTIPEAQVEFDFYRCAGPTGCGRYLTRPEVVTGLRNGHMCRCGNLHISPSNPPRLWWLRPRCLAFAYLRMKGRI